MKEWRRDDLWGYTQSCIDRRRGMITYRHMCGLLLPLCYVISMHFPDGEYFTYQTTRILSKQTVEGGRQLTIYYWTYLEEWSTVRVFSLHTVSGLGVNFIKLKKSYFCFSERFSILEGLRTMKSSAQGRCVTLMSKHTMMRAKSSECSCMST